MKEKKLTLKQILSGDYEVHGKAVILGIVLWCIAWVPPLWAAYILANISSASLFGVPNTIWAIGLAFMCGVMFAKGMRIRIIRTKRTQNKLKEQVKKKK